ncbi:hypothetical protein E3P77_00187 [Wallemia ichthyophaga]|uniref:Chromatin structure-remodeling complex subunit sfh1 n=2 Tax=Wallemia ichthyophaga TaxID=245174 RepID=A0A4T0FXP9_WALIC|nr:SWI/SNF chromatin-remodeling complex subunit snf5 [Wallemia ichthyophaga EXF-994]TIA72698.1 hypothetical protein E3P91_01833 [Wallemia ichthyophaga]EOR04752.1 SWI/SNF chromatin-remodeling complex subunit snf5 [Wallemia ichthyophaga EXF-994]TIA81399.1 hypothetical protein E3P98_02071 [Wallemia ichthyophaga]TIA93055.1 hypothetical protein E3P97_01093 [Wallemia ichthyophaga]TIB15369.1 hypothetical protein E3P90_00834 [Wallemia ichthyophaga]
MDDNIDWPVIYQRIRTSFQNALAESIVNKLRKDQFNRSSLYQLLKIAEHKNDDATSLEYLHGWANSENYDIIPPPKRGPGRPPKSSQPEDDETVDIPYKHVWKTGDPVLLQNTHKPTEKVGGGQALYTTFPARIKQGISTLMQPVNATLNPQGVIEPKYSNPQKESLAMQAIANSRRKGHVNYAEKDPDDFEDEGESDDESGSRRRSSRRQTMDGGSTGPSTPLPSGTKRGDQYSYVGPYLSDIPPGSSIVSEYLDKDRMFRLQYASERDLESSAARTFLPVPIRIEIDHENWRLRDTFVWNANETVLRPATFAEGLCSDLKIPTRPYADQIASLMQQQIEEHQAVVEVDVSHRERLKELSNGGLVTVQTTKPGEDEDDYESNLVYLRERPQERKFAGAKQVEEVDGPPEEQDIAMNLETDLRVILNLDVQFANFHLVDKVEWDLCSPMPPELFAETLCLDLGLSGEAKAAIAHVIHEELIRHKKEAIESGLMGASTGQLSDLDHPLFNGKGPRKLESVWREWHEADEYIPRLNYYAAADIEKRELEREKSTRRMRRDISKPGTGFGSRRRYGR